MKLHIDRGVLNAKNETEVVFSESFGMTVLDKLQRRSNYIVFHAISFMVWTCD